MKSFKQFLFEREDLGVEAPKLNTQPTGMDAIENRLKEPLKSRSEFSSDQEYKNYLDTRSTQLKSDRDSLTNTDDALGTAIGVGDAIRTGVETGMSVIPGGSQVVAAERAVSGAINYAAGNESAAAEDAVYGAAALVPGGATPLGRAAIGATRETAAGIAAGNSPEQIATRTASGAVEGALPGAKQGARLITTVGTAATNKFRADNAAAKAKDAVNSVTQTVANNTQQTPTTVGYNRPQNTNKPKV